MTEKPSLEERYAAATNSSDLSLNPNKATDADVLLAAAYASTNNQRGSLGLRFWRMKAKQDMAALHELAAIAGFKLHKRSKYKGRKKLRSIEARDLAARAIIWWTNPVCRPCNGLGHPLMPHSPVIHFGHDCPVCHGSGQYPLHRVVPPGCADEARWLVDEIDAMCRVVFNDMAPLMANRMTL
jgi:hypothetical protein